MGDELDEIIEKANKIVVDWHTGERPYSDDVIVAEAFLALARNIEAA